MNKDNKKAWNLLKSEYYKNGGAKLCKRWEYSYYPDNTKKTSTLYNAKGKAKYVWNYDCKPEGELVQQHKDTTLVCKKDELDAMGNKVVTERKFNEKGEPTKVVCVYSKEDKLLSNDVYDKNNILRSHILYGKDWNWLEYISYDKEGVEEYKQLYKYDDKGNKTEYAYYKKQALKHTNIYSYNEKGLVVKAITTILKKNNEKSEVVTEYAYMYY